MHPYVLIPLASAVASAAFGATLLASDPGHPRNRYAALLLFVTAFWAVCEVVWNTAPDATTALWVIRFSAPGWIWIGPLWLRLFSERSDHPPLRLRRLLPWMIAGGAVVLAIEWTTPWMHTRAVRTEWGWGYEVGPAFVLWYVYCVSLILLGMFLEVRAWDASDSPAERRQRPWLVAAVAIPLVVASLTDGILPIFAIQVPRLGTASLALMGGVIVWSQLRYGYSLLAPGNFARDILEALPEGVVLVSLDGRIRSANGAMGRLTGSRPARLVGQRLGEMVPGAPVDPPRDGREIESELRRPGRRPIPVAVSSWMLRDKQAWPLGFVWVVRDLQEVAALRSRLITSGRLAAVGQLAAGIAHEINNPLAFVRTNLALLQEHWEEIGHAWGKGRRAREFEDRLEEGRELLSESLEGVDRTASIVRDVKSFSHAGRDRRELVDLNRVLDDALRMLSPQLRGRAEVERSYGEIPRVMGSSQEMRQVFVNLMANAGQAIEENGTIRLSTHSEGDSVAVSIEDDGVGIPQELVERIFDPFFTTKPTGEGTGLGLAISYEIVRGHRGEIEVESQPGRGTRFRVRLPVGGDPTPD